MKELKFPVLPDKREEILASVDTIYRFHDTHMEVTMRYKYRQPKDEDDEYSPMSEDRLVDYHCAIFRSSIMSVGYIWNYKTEKYLVEIASGSKIDSYNVPTKSDAIQLVDEIRYWALGKQKATDS